MVNVMINDVPVSVPEGTAIMEAAAEEREKAEAEEQAKEEAEASSEGV